MNNDPKPLAHVVIKPASWLHNIDFVKQLILNNNVLIAFLSEKGSGKTTFANLLQADLDLPPAIQTLVLTASPQLTRARLQSEIESRFNLPAQASLTELVLQRNALKTHTLLIMDEAHFLSALMIEDLLQALYLQKENVFFHVCLMGDVSLAPCLNQLARAPYDDMIHNIDLGVLNESETKTYVMQNMVPVPGAEKIISDERMVQFHQLTEGQLTRINGLMTPFFSHKPKPKSHHLKWLLHGSIAASVVLASTAGAYLWLTMGLQSPPPYIERLASTRPIEEPFELHLQSMLTPYDVAVVRQAIEPASLRKLDMIPEEPSPLVVMDKVVVAPKIMPLKSVQQHKASKPVFKENESRFTIQILASHHQEPLLSFVKKHPRMVSSKVRKIQRGGLTWYVLTMGNYPDRARASRAILQLPKDIAQYKPWVRSTEDWAQGKKRG